MLVEPYGQKANLVVHIGPDTMGFACYKSKKNLRDCLNRAIKNAKTPFNNSCSILFKGRRYNKKELQEAEIMTLEEYFLALCNAYKVDK